MTISKHRATFAALWLYCILAKINGVYTLLSQCVCEYLRYRISDRLSESHFGLSHHTGTVVFPLHPLKQHTKIQKWEKNRPDILDRKG